MVRHHEGKAAGLADQLERTTFSDDPDAIEQLEEKIQKAEAEAEGMKAANKIVRKFKNDQHNGCLALEQAGFLAGEAQRLFQPDWCGRIGFPDYATTNLRANIRRMKGRIEEIRRRQNTQAKAERNGGVVIEGTEYVRVTFSERPDREILDALKASGFTWSGGSWCGKREKIPAIIPH
jgi:hypothetical protein